MTCREALEFLMAYVDGELTADARAAFDRHLSSCDGCRDYLASYRATVRLGRAASASAAAAADDDAGRAGVPEDLVRAILAARGKPPGGRP